VRNLLNVQRVDTAQKLLPGKERLEIYNRNLNQKMKSGFKGILFAYYLTDTSNE